MAPQVFTATERQPVDIPLSCIVKDDQSIDVYPQVRRKGFFDLDYRNDKLVVVAGNFIGHIPINDRVTLQVNPKVGIGNLVHILSTAREQLRYLDFFRRGYVATGALEPTIFEFLARCLAHEMRTLAQEGVFRTYEPRRESRTNPKARFLFAPTINKFWSRSINHKIECQYFYLDADTPLNRLIKFTLWYTLNQLTKLPSQDRALIRQLAEDFDYFGMVTLDRSRDFLEAAQLLMREDRIPVIRNYYKNICRICELIIEQVGIQLRNAGEDIELASFIISMESVFEKYLLNVLRDSPKLANDAITVLDGNTEGKKSLFSESVTYFEAKPDIVIRKQNSVTTLIDAKYKEKVGEAERYQVITHALSYGSKNCVLALPSRVAGEKPLQWIGRIGSTQTIELFVYRFDLESGDLKQEETSFVDAVLQMSYYN